MTNTHNRALAVLLGTVFVVLAATAFWPRHTAAGVTYSAPTLKDTFVAHTFFTATTTTATSTNDTRVPTNQTLRIDGAKKVNYYFSRGGATGPNTGSSRFEVEVSPDGSNWYDFNKLVQNAATSTTPTVLATVTISAATSTTVVALDLRNDAFRFTRCIVVETTDGDHTCSATAEF